MLRFGDDHGSQLVIPMYESAPQLTRVADLLLRTSILSRGHVLLPGASQVSWRLGSKETFAPHLPKPASDVLG